MSFRPDEYVIAQTVDEVTHLLGMHGQEAAIIAGATVFHELVAKDMVPQVKKLVDISRLTLSYINNQENGIRVGATTRLSELRDASLFSVQGTYAAVSEAANILPIQVVEVGTIGGNVSAGLPILNFPPVIMALDAELKTAGPHGERSIPADEFYLDYFLTALQPDEFLTEVWIPKFPEHTATVFKASKILSLDYPTISIAVRVTLDGNDRCSQVRIVFGSVGRIPVRARKAEKKLIGKSLEEKEIREVAELIPSEIDPISDLRAPAQYRKDMSRVLAEDALLKAREGIRG